MKELCFSKIFPNAVVCCLLTLTLWTVTSLFHYGIKTRKWGQFKKRNQAEKLNFGRIYSSIVLCGLMVIVYDIVGLIYMNTGFATVNTGFATMNTGFATMNTGFATETTTIEKALDKYCDVLSDLAYSVYASVLLSTSLFFWFRQRVFFQNRLLNVNYNKCVRVLSALSLFLTLVLAVGVVIFKVYPDDHKSTKDGCVYAPEGDNLRIGSWVAIIVVIVLCQGMYWGLFAYALKSTMAPAKDIVVCNNSSNHEEEQRSTFNKKSVELISGDQTVSRLSFKQRRNAAGSQSACSKTIRLTIIKTFAAAVTTTLLDIFEIILVNYISKPHEHRRFNVMLASFNLSLHFFLIILCFVDYRKMFTSFCSLTS